MLLVAASAASSIGGRSYESRGRLRLRTCKAGVTGPASCSLPLIWQCTDFPPKARDHAGWGASRYRGLLLVTRIGIPATASTTRSGTAKRSKDCNALARELGWVVELSTEIGLIVLCSHEHCRTCEHEESAVLVASRISLQAFRTSKTPKTR